VHRIWRRTQEFKSFIQAVASDQDRDKGRLYSVSAVVETYFELVTMALLVEFGKKLKQGKSIRKLVKQKVLSTQHADLMMQVLQLRNDLLHNLLFEPSTARLKKFRRKALNGAFSPDEEMRCSDIEAREAIFTADLVTAYAQIYNAYDGRVGVKISAYIEGGGA
jgi:hypothetical protein